MSFLHSTLPRLQHTHWTFFLAFQSTICVFLFVFGIYMFFYNVFIALTGIKYHISLKKGKICITKDKL